MVINRIRVFFLVLVAVFCLATVCPIYGYAAEENISEETGMTENMDEGAILLESIKGVHVLKIETISYESERIILSIAFGIFLILIECFLARHAARLFPNHSDTVGMLFLFFLVADLFILLSPCPDETKYLVELSDGFDIESFYKIAEVNSSDGITFWVTLLN